MSTSLPKIGLLGGGQLGKMMLYETRKFDITTHVLDSSLEAPCRIACDHFTQGDLMDYDTVYTFGKKVDILTFEIEGVNIEALEALEKEGKKVYHEACFENNCYFRESYMKNNDLDNFMFNWDAIYYQKTNSDPIKLTEDKSVVRAFTKNEWELFLYLNDFTLLEFIDRKSYAFDTYVVVAKKN